MKAVITVSNVTECLKHSRVDYLPLPVGDGITDDTEIIQARETAGLPWLVGSKGSKFRITRTINLRNGSGWDRQR